MIDKIMFSLLGCFAGGVCVGAVYFAGLWRTVEKLPRALHPTRLLFYSWLARSVFLWVSFYGLFRLCPDWRCLLSALAGVVTVRFVLTAAAKRKNALAKEKA